MFASTKKLPILGFGGESIPNQYLLQADAPFDLTIFLPGMGYSCDMPLFYYIQNLQEVAGSDLLRVEYNYGFRPEFRALPFEEQLRRIVFDAGTAISLARSQRAYQKITIVGKSLGTLAIAHLLEANLLDDSFSQILWLTPVLHDETVIRQMKRFRGRSLMAIGTDDPADDAQKVSELCALPGMSAVVVDRADHGFDVDANVIGSIQAVEQAMHAVARFFSVQSQ